MDTIQWKKLLHENKLIKEEQGQSMLDGLTKQQARRLLYKKLTPYTKGIYRDQDWRHVRKVWDELDKMNVVNYITDTQYDYRNMPPQYKEWHYTIEFTDKKGKPQKLQGILTAHGAGSVDDPLDRYDITIGLF